jgi:preprotein translocase subunit SecB
LTRILKRRSVEAIPLQHSIEVVVSASEDLHRGKVTLNSRVFENAEQSNYPFSLEVSLTGYFSTTEIMTREELGRFCEINGTAALFPFLRSAIADVTKAANFQPLLLPLMNIHNLVEQSKLADESQ